MIKMTSVLDQAYFKDELAALAKLERIVWPQGPVCPHCGATDRIGRVVSKWARPELRFCNYCRKQFRVTIGTVFQGTHVPMHKWLQAVFLLSSGLAQINTRQLHLLLGVTYKTTLQIVRLLKPLIGTSVASPGGSVVPPSQRRRLTAVALRPAPSGALSDPTDQHLRFMAVARALGCREGETYFDRVLVQICRNFDQSQSRRQIDGGP